MPEEAKQDRPPEAIGVRMVEHREDPLETATRELARETRRLKWWTAASAVLAAGTDLARLLRP